MTPVNDTREPMRHEVEELADRLMGRGINALVPDDWPILVLALEAYSAKLERDALAA